YPLTPFWAKSEMNLFNARSEGDSNQSDDPKVHGTMGIIQKKAFRKPIRSQRCLVIATAFIAGPKDVGLSKPYLFYLQKHKNPFAFAGIWDTWINPATLEKEDSFAIITTTANTLLQKIGEHRMPVILTDGQAKRWINSNTELSRITAMLKKYDSDQMNAYPITPRLKDPTQNDKALIQPSGERLIIEEAYTRPAFPYTSDFHQAKKAQKANDQTDALGDRIKPTNELFKKNL
ncbi:MAG: SOS response-associated peptidase, partial [Bacteroidales bacterium]